MTKFFLYLAPGACSRITMNALEEAELEYGVRAINIFKGEQKSPEYRQINPKGKVPTLTVDGTVLTENVAILMYIHKLKPGATLLPTADSPLEEAKLTADLTWCSSTIHPMVRQVRAPIRYTDGDPSGVITKGAEYLTELLPQVEERVSNECWWYGDNWSIMDVYLNWCYSTAALADVSLTAYHAIQSHGERVRARPSYQRALAREKAAMEKAGIELPGGGKLV